MFDASKLIQKFDELVLGRRPMLPNLKGITELCFHASSVPSEGRYPYIGVIICEARRPSLPGMLHFDPPADVTDAPELLSKLSFACQPFHRVLVLDETAPEGILRITGTCRLPQVGLNTLVPYVVVEAPAAGWLRIIYEEHAVEYFRGSEHDTSGLGAVAAWIQRDWVHSFRRRFVSLTPMGSAVRIGSEAVVVNDREWRQARGEVLRTSERVAGAALAQALAQLLHAVRANRHGGSLLVLPARNPQSPPLGDEGVALAMDSTETDTGGPCYAYFAWWTLRLMARSHPDLLTDMDRTTAGWQDRMVSNVQARVERAWLRVCQDADANAGLTQVDGALVLNHDLIPTRAMALFEMPPPVGTSRGARVGGARHAALNWAVSRAPGSVGFAVSQDGRVTAFGRGGRTSVLVL